jgi:RecB family exonuclease
VTVTQATEHERAPFEPTLISASRIDQLLTCGVAFKYRYIDRLPREGSGSSALFGSAVHRALETWAPNRGESLDKHVVQGWQDATKGTVVHDFLVKYDQLARRAINLCDEIMLSRPEIKMPRVTSDFKKSQIAKEISQFLAEWLPYLNTRSPWWFTERDPLPALYENSLRVMKKYEEQWQHLPAPFETELQFSIEWRGFTLNGYIDTIEPVIERKTGEIVGLGIMDYKTYAVEPAEYKDWRQTVLYAVAVEELIASGDLNYAIHEPMVSGLDYVRLLERRFWQVTALDKERFYEQLVAYRERVSRGDFMPACKNVSPNMCDYPSICCQKVVDEGMCERVQIEV